MKPDGYLRKYLEKSLRYIDTGENGLAYRALPERCGCRKLVTPTEGDIYVARGSALPVWKLTSRALEMDLSRVWMPQLPRTPRVDLISRTDIERFVDLDPDAIALIEAIHEMHLAERAKLIVPERLDPLEGRQLFPFAADQRTAGGR